MYENLMPDLTPEEYAELKADIAERGVMIPIDVDENGVILDGYQRKKVCDELGIDCPKIIRSGMTDEEKRTHIRKLNLARRHLTQEQKRKLIQEQLIETPEMSDRQIARSLGVSPTTTGTIRKEMESAGELSRLDSCIGSDGKEYPRHTERTSSETVSGTADETMETQDLSEGEIENKGKHKPHVAFNTGNNEWYTPSPLIEAARNVMGSIDLDPASCEEANKGVKAERYYTIETNGLEQKWNGNVWLNPPYSVDLIGKFAEKLVKERENYRQAIVLVNNSTETEWFNTLISISSAVVFPKGRVKFYTPFGENGKVGNPIQGQAIVYIGDHPEMFMKTFSQFGWGGLLS